jgi:5-formyltetrahydrofolate cyclo-ligase
VNSAELKRAKKRVRAAVLARRDAIDPTERARLGADIVDRFLGLPRVRTAHAVMAFWSFGSEVPMDPLIARLIAAGVTVALPRIVEGELEARAWRPGEAVTETHFGAKEPEGGQVIDPARLDVVAVPGVAFDREGRRIGYGGGFYDRFLPRTDAVRAAVAFGVQIVDEPLPAGSFDEPVHTIVTESDTFRCGPP